VFDIRFEEDKKITLSGRFSAAGIGEAEQILNSVKGDCIIDFKELEYISSAGIGSLLKTYIRLKESGNTLKLVNLSKHVSEVIRYSGLDKVFIIEE
jgi:anti-anti-sigma factor